MSYYSCLHLDDLFLYTPYRHQKKISRRALDSPASIDDSTVVYQLSTLCESNNMFLNSSLLKFYTEDQSTVMYRTNSKW